MVINYRSLPETDRLHNRSTITERIFSENVHRQSVNKCVLGRVIPVSSFHPTEWQWHLPTFLFSRANGFASKATSTEAKIKWNVRIIIVQCFNWQRLIPAEISSALNENFQSFIAVLGKLNGRWLVFDVCWVIRYAIFGLMVDRMTVSKTMSSAVHRYGSSRLSETKVMHAPMINMTWQTDKLTQVHNHCDWMSGGNASINDFINCLCVAVAVGDNKLPKLFILIKSIFE